MTIEFSVRVVGCLIGCLAGVVLVCFLFAPSSNTLSPKMDSQTEVLTPREDNEGAIESRNSPLDEATGELQSGAGNLGSMSPEPPALAVLRDSSDSVISDMTDLAVQKVARDYYGSTVNSNRRLERTQRAFEMLYEKDACASVATLERIVDEADEEGRVWFRDELVKRYHAEPDHRLRRYTLQYIEKVFPEKAGELALETLTSDPGFWMPALRCLANVGGEREVGVLSQFIAENGVNTQPGHAAIQAMGAIGRRHEQPVPALKALLSRQDLSIYSESRIISALGNAADPDCYRIFDAAIKRQERELRMAGIGGMSALSRYRKSYPDVARRALRLLRFHVNDADTSVGDLAVLKLGGVGSSEDISLIQRYCDDKKAAMNTCPEHSRRWAKYAYSAKLAQGAIDSIRRRESPEEIEGFHIYRPVLEK